MADSIVIQPISDEALRKAADAANGTYYNLNLYIPGKAELAVDIPNLARSLLEAREALRAVVESAPTDSEYECCSFNECRASSMIDGIEHSQECPMTRARACLPEHASKT